MQDEPKIPHTPDAPPAPEGGSVTVKVDIERTVSVLRGDYTVAALQALIGAPPDYELDTIRDGSLVPLQPEEILHIKGGEDFVAVPKRGHSS